MPANRVARAVRGRPASAWQLNEAGVYNIDTFLQRPGALTVMVVLAGLLLLTLLLRFVWRCYRRRHPLVPVLKRLGALHVRNLIVPDGVGGTIQTDFLVLMRGGVLVLDVKNYRGVLFGAENAPLWSQMIKSRSYKFANPLPENVFRVQSVQHLLPGVPVIGRVVFTRDAQFPREMPRGVSMLDTLLDDLGAFAGAASLPYLDAWKRLCQAGESAR